MWAGGQGENRTHCVVTDFGKDIYVLDLSHLFLMGLPVEYEGWGCCISFDLSSFKELSRCYEKCWKSAAILLFAKIMYTLLHRENFRHCYNPITNFIASSNVLLSFEFVKRWSSLFDNVTTRYELWACSQLTGKIRQNNPAFTACSNYVVCTE